MMLTAQSDVRIHVDDGVSFDVDQQHGDDCNDDADSRRRADATQGKPSQLNIYWRPGAYH